MATFTIKGKAFTTNGELPAVDSTAPDFSLTDSRLKDKSLADFKGKKKLLYIVVSLDTDVCEATTRKFSEAFKQRDDAVLLLISADLPYAQSRYCGKGKMENIQALSGMRNRNFAKDYGVLIQDGPLAGIMARAVVVLDENNKVLYTQLVEELTSDPDYEQALAALA
ncbi:MAG: thiol peroxidase [Gammaproteobacteria bacterium]|nr:thiol peroxidase [Gammaproteobacteria bacterium]